MFDEYEQFRYFWKAETDNFVLSLLYYIFLFPTVRNSTNTKFKNSQE